MEAIFVLYAVGLVLVGIAWTEHRDNQIYRIVAFRRRIRAKG